jgi:hypothetical protein
MLLNPILHECSEELGEQLGQVIHRPEGERAKGYMNWAPKVLMRAFYGGQEEALGGVVFTLAAAGCLARLLDNADW